MTVVGLSTAICRELGLEPRTVARLVLEPRLVIATVYKLDEHGAKYLGDDGEPATETVTFDLEREPAK